MLHPSRHLGQVENPLWWCQTTRTADPGIALIELHWADLLTHADTIFIIREWVHLGGVIFRCTHFLMIKMASAWVSRSARIQRMIKNWIKVSAIRAITGSKSCSVLVIDTIKAYSKPDQVEQASHYYRLWCSTNNQTFNCYNVSTVSNGLVVKMATYHSGSQVGSGDHRDTWGGSRGVSSKIIVWNQMDLYRSVTLSVQ